LFALFYQAARGGTKQKKGPIDVEILKKTPQAKQNIVPDRQDRVIKPDIRKETPKIIPDRFVPRSKGLNIPPPPSPKPPQKRYCPNQKVIRTRSLKNSWKQVIKEIWKHKKGQLNK